MRFETINQILGFSLILLVIVLNMTFTLICINTGNSCAQMDTYSWGFTNALMVMVGLFKLGGN